MISSKEFYVAPYIETVKVVPEKGIAYSASMENYTTDILYDRDGYWD